MLKGVYLTLLMGPTIPVPVPQQLIDGMVSTQVTVSAGQRSGFQLVFHFSKTSLISTTLLAVGYFDPKIRVIIVATVNGIPNVLMDGVITRQDVTPSSEPGMSTLSITGEDISLLMDLNDGADMRFPAMTSDMRVRLLLLKYIIYGVIPLVIPVVPPDFPDPTQEIPAQKGSDLAYIKYLADQCGYVFYIVPGPVPGTNTAYWGPEVRIGIPQSALNINMDVQTNVESLSFGYDGLSAKSLTIQIQEPITKLSISIPVPDISLLRPPLALKQATPLKQERLMDVAKYNPIRAATIGLSKAAASSDAITGSGQLDVLRYGHVLSARQLVGVRGASLAYDGLYYVKSVTHNIKQGEYKQSFTLTRNGLIPLTPGVIP